MSAPAELPVAPASATMAPTSRAQLVRRARLLAWVGFAWHGLEAAVAIGAGIGAGSVALIGFGADSLIEMLAGLVVLWRFASRRASVERAERRAQELIAVSFFAIGIYVAVEATRSLVIGDEPAVSWVGIGLSLVTLATMPPLAITKARVADALGSSATKSESRQTMLCAYLSAGLLLGLGLNALTGWWWADPVAALGIAAVAIREGRDAWHGESCCTAPIDLDCRDDCCAVVTRPRARPTGEPDLRGLQDGKAPLVPGGSDDRSR